MRDLESDILETQKLLDSYFYNRRCLGTTPEERFGGIIPTYFWTNENVREVLDLENIDNLKRALTVLSSGDQLFSLVGKNISQIDTFDINYLAEYYVLGLKKAMIRKYNYDDFLKFCSKSFLFSNNNDQELDEKMAFLESLLPFMEEKYRLFWQEVFDYAFKLWDDQKSWHLQYLFTNIEESFKVMFYVGYLHSPDSYNKVKKHLDNCEITFQSIDVREIGRTFHGQYDLIYLSNILDFMESRWGWKWDYEKLQEFEHSLDAITHENTLTFLKYVIRFSVSNFPMKGNISKKELFWDSAVTTKDLKSEWVKTISNVRSEYIDGIVLKRGK